jgi:lysophospholipase L1-like esterase
MLNTFLVAGAGVTLTYNDTANTLTITATASGGLDAEGAQDAVGNIMAAAGLASVGYNDAAGTITVTVLVEDVQDLVGNMVTAGAGASINYDDAAGTITITNTDRGSVALAGRTVSTGTGLLGGGTLGADRTLSVDVEWLMDYLNGTLVAGTNVSLNYDDAAGTITISSSGASAEAVTSVSDKVDVLAAATVNGTPRADATMPVPPTRALSAAGATTTISSSALVGADNTGLTYLGASMSNVGTVGGVTNCYRQNSATLTDSVPQYLLNVEFETDAPVFEVLVRSENTNDAKIRVWIDGERVTTAPVSVGTSGSWYRYKVTFPNAAPRRVRVEGQYVTFGGIQKAIVQTIWRTTRDLGPKAVIVGDSYLLGISGTASPGVFLDRPWVWDGWGARAGRYLGWNVYPSAVSGTGYLATDSGTEVKYADRLTTDVVNLSPDIVVVSGGLNDQGLTLASVQTQVNAVYAALRTGLPNATIYALEPFSPLDTYDTNLGTIAGYISAAAATNNCTYISGCSNWFTGSGYAGATSGVGNSDIYIAPDGYHPTAAAGYPYLAERFVAAIGTRVARKAAPSGGAIRLFRIVPDSNVSLSAGVDTFIPWASSSANSPLIDEIGGGISPLAAGAPYTSFTIPETGYYRFEAFIGVFDSNRILLEWYNFSDSVSYGAVTSTTEAATEAWCATNVTSGWIYLTAGKVIRLRVNSEDSGDIFSSGAWATVERRV